MPSLALLLEANIASRTGEKGRRPGATLDTSPGGYLLCKIFKKKRMRRGYLDLALPVSGLDRSRGLAVAQFSYPPI
jgi:hypothetical protein